MSEHDGITSMQTIGHTIELSPHGIGTSRDPGRSRPLRINVRSFVVCLNQAAAITVGLAHTTLQ